jgi:hypothetical protein
MLKATLFLQRSTTSANTDDIIKIYEDDNYVEMYKVVYSTYELQKSKQFYMSRSSLVTYISDLLKALVYDNEPFEFIQVCTTIHPSILYHVSDLDKPEIRYLIEDAVYAAMKTPVQNVRQDTRLVSK